MNKKCPTLPFFRLGSAMILCSYLVAGCAGTPTEVRYDDRMKISTANQYEKVTSQYIVRPGDRPDFQPRAKETAPVYQPVNEQPVEPKPADLRLVLDASDILFAFDKWVLRADVVPELDKWAEYLKHNPQVTAEIDGYADSTGPASYNLTLSERRAQAVANYLIKKGIDPKRFVTRGFGETYPVAPNTTSEGRQKNRRVELKL